MLQTTSELRRRIATLRWVFPLSFSVLAASYQLVFARWVRGTFSEGAHYGVEILLYSFGLPVFAFWLFCRVDSWLEARESSEAGARVRERRLAMMTVGAADGIVGIDFSGRIESWNQGAESLLGFREDEVVGHRLSELLGDEASAEVELRWLIENVRQAGHLRGHETTWLDFEGRERVVELTATNLDVSSDAVGLISLILRDVTFRRRREQEIQQRYENLNQEVEERTQELAEKIEELARANADLKKLDQMRAEILSMVSHQIRAPLTNMRGAVERMESSCPAVSPTCSRMFHILEQQVGRVDRLVGDVLNTARIEADELVVHLEPLSLLPVVRHIVEQIQPRLKDRAIHLPTKPGLPLVLADRDHLAEVLVNLLDNADKYSTPGEVITVDVRADQLEVVLSVRDHGPGIPGGDFERVFDKFFRAESGDSQAAYGYGLGLYICRSLIQAQGGRIWAENHPQGGAVFSFAMPVWRGEDGRT